MNHESTFWYQSESTAGVEVKLRKVTFGRRAELLTRIGTLVKKVECLSAGPGDEDKLAAGVEHYAAEEILLAWAIEELRGFAIDGSPPTVRSLIDAGPEDLVRELLSVIHREIGLTEEERKN